VPDTAEFYERDAAQYDALRWHSRTGTYTDMVQKAIVDQLLGNMQGQKLLDIGAGTGRFTTQMIEKDAQVTSLDISLSMLRYAKDILTTDSTLIQADATYLPFRAQSFDGCISVNVFSHIVNYKTTLREISRVLRPDGFLVFNFPNLLSYYLPAGLLVNVRGRALRRDVYTHWYTLRSFRLACAEFGLILNRVLGQVHLPDSIAILGLDCGLKGLDRLSRSSILRFLCPSLFVRALKKVDGLNRSGT
jgi:ubiquinone/menaquinone biosynthesis C-methylase UbiE